MIGSDLLVAQLAALGIREIALNPGATLRGLHESLLNGGHGVRAITCLHEGVAVGLAHGYAKAAGRPMAVGLHDTVGVLNAALGVYNAWVDAAPILLLGGVGPLDTQHRRPWIDWVHTTSDTPRPIRDAVVWADTPASIEAALVSIRRAHQRARSTVPGPAYVGLDLTLQERDVDDALRPAAALEPWRVEPDGGAIGEAARLLDRASRPVIACDRPLSDEAASAAVALAERLGAALVELEGAPNVPAGHPLDRSGERAAVFAAADVILLVDVRDATLVVAGGVDRGARIIDLSAVPLRDASWMVTAADIGDGLRLVGEPAAGLARIAAAIRRDRRPRPDWPPDTTPVGPLRVPSDTAVLDRAGIASVVGTALPRERLVVAHGSLGGLARRALDLRRPSQYIGRSGGEGLGYALPASIGAALALRDSDRLVVGFETDGDTLYLPQALWTAAHVSAPLLAIVENNQSYARDELHQREIARHRGRDVEVSAGGVRLTDPAVDFAGLARSLGVEAAGPVTTAGELRRALERGRAVVERGEPFVIEARTGG